MTQPASADLFSEIMRLVDRFGPEAVKKAANELIKLPRGRKAMDDDWEKLKPFLDADADDWLAGRDPLNLRTNNFIATKFSEQYPGQSAPSTVHRIAAKLSAKPTGRVWRMLLSAVSRSREGHPYEIHLRALRELRDFDNSTPLWLNYRLAQAAVRQYRQEQGCEAPAGMSIVDIEKANAAGQIKA
jgi:hypothetical protein